MRQNEMASLAMRMPSDLGSSGLGSVQRRETKFGNEFYVLSRTGKMRKRSRFKLCLVKRNIQINKYNKSCFKSRGYSYIKASYIMVIIYIK